MTPEDYIELTNSFDRIIEDHLSVTAWERHVQTIEDIRSDWYPDFEGRG